jgi:N-acetylmuramoyl-L-alanine amidase
MVVHGMGLPLEEVVPKLDQLGASAHYFVPQLTASELLSLFPERHGWKNLRFPDCVPVIQWVPDDRMAWHAGRSYFGDLNRLPSCAEGLNARSIGIEFHLPGYGAGDGSDWYVFAPCTRAQQETGMALIRWLMGLHGIAPHHLLAHSTIAVGRKTDPGPRFFWRDLAAAGMGYMPPPVAVDFRGSVPPDALAWAHARLVAFGFRIPDAAASDPLAMGLFFDAYIMQFAPELWVASPHALTPALLASLAALDIGVFGSNRTEQKAKHRDQ